MYSALKLRAAAGVALAAFGYLLADRVVSRLADHRGHFLLTHHDEVTTPIARRPRRAVVVVVDGLSAHDARELPALQRLRSHGRCALTHVGLPSVSRPVYAVISSGVEQARTGVRNNDDSSPAPVDSIWSRARAAGYRVAYRSELGWWGELFPRGFDRATVLPPRENLFAAPFTDELTLVHPVYVDDLSHDHGRVSPQVRAALRRLNGELNGALDTLDLSRDLAVLTSDHGHRDAGGHGGPALEITRVITCFAGPGVRRETAYPHLDSRDIAPTLAVLLGVAIPRHAATRRDPEAMIRAVVDRDAVGAAYYDARVEGLARIRRRVARGLASATGEPRATWSTIDEIPLHRRRFRVVMAAVLTAIAVALTLARFRSRLAALAWSVAVPAVYLAIYRWLSGGLDATSLNGRAFFTRNVLIASTAAIALGSLAHLTRGGSARSLSDRAALLAALTLCANLSHIGVYGWPLGYPLPDPLIYFAPFLMSTFQLTAGLALALASVIAARREGAAIGRS